MAPFTKKIPTEAQESVWFMEWAELYKPIAGFVMHIPNERKCSPRAGARLKAMGVRKGVPDYFIAVAKGAYHGLFLEMKRRDQRNRKKRIEQDNWLEKLKDQNYCAEYVYGWEHASQVCKDYVNGKVEKNVSK